MNGETKVASERCLCREAIDSVLSATGLRNSEARQHFRNSRAEFLKGLRAILDARISALQTSGQEGTKVSIE